MLADLGGRPPRVAVAVLELVRTSAEYDRASAALDVLPDRARDVAGALPTVNLVRLRNRDVDATSTRRTHSLERAQLVAGAIVRELAPACERIEIAGSIRRRAGSVKDIEVVCVPRGVPSDLFGAPDIAAPTDLDRVLEGLVDMGRIRARVDAAGRIRLGRRYRALEAVRAEIALDLFCVLPPAQWGAQLAIRTGPAEYSARLVTSCQRRGLRCRDGRLVREDGTEVNTPEERDFIRACGMPYAEPWERR